MAGRLLGKTKRVDAKGASDTKNGIGGYSIVQAETAEAATKLFGKDHPHLQMPGAGSKSSKSCIFPECERRDSLARFRGGARVTWGRN